MLITTPIRNPFDVERLPLLGRLYRKAFRSGSPSTPAPIRFCSRIAFYLLRAMTFVEAKGTLKVHMGNEIRYAKFDARNRQFNAIYFDKYSAGYEPEVTALVEALVPDNGVFYDIGSNWGFFSIYLASRPNFSGHIHAFEPWPRSFRDLNGLVGELGLESTIKCHNIALSNEEGTAFMSSPSHSGLAHLSNDDGIKVKITSLDHIDLAPPSLIKIDAEGAEDKILLGGNEYLSTHTPMLVFENRANLFGDTKCSAVLSMLKDLDYKLFIVKPKISRDSLNIELTPITAETRNNYSDCDNLFACHQSSVGQLNKKIS